MMEAAEDENTLSLEVRFLELSLLPEVLQTVSVSRPYIRAVLQPWNQQISSGIGKKKHKGIFQWAATERQILPFTFTDGSQGTIEMSVWDSGGMVDNVVDGAAHLDLKRINWQDLHEARISQVESARLVHNGVEMGKLKVALKLRDSKDEEEDTLIESSLGDGSHNTFQSEGSLSQLSDRSSDVSEFEGESLDVVNKRLDPQNRMMRTAPGQIQSAGGFGMRFSMDEMIPEQRPVTTHQSSVVSEGKAFVRPSAQALTFQQDALTLQTQRTWLDTTQPPFVCWMPDKPVLYVKILSLTIHGPLRKKKASGVYIRAVASVYGSQVQKRSRAAPYCTKTEDGQIRLGWRGEVLKLRMPLDSPPTELCPSLRLETVGADSTACAEISLLALAHQLDKTFARELTLSPLEKADGTTCSLKVYFQMSLKPAFELEWPRKKDMLMVSPCQFSFSIPALQNLLQNTELLEEYCWVLTLCTGGFREISSGWSKFSEMVAFQRGYHAATNDIDLELVRIQVGVGSAQQSHLSAARTFSLRALAAWMAEKDLEHQNWVQFWHGLKSQGKVPQISMQLKIEFEHFESSIQNAVFAQLAYTTPSITLEVSDKEESPRVGKAGRSFSSFNSPLPKSQHMRSGFVKHYESPKSYPSSTNILGQSKLKAASKTNEETSGIIEDGFKTGVIHFWVQKVEGVNPISLKQKLSSPKAVRPPLTYSKSLSPRRFSQRNLHSPNSHSSKGKPNDVDIPYVWYICSKLNCKDCKPKFSPAGKTSQPSETNSTLAIQWDFLTTFTVNWSLQEISIPQLQAEILYGTKKHSAKVAAEFQFPLPGVILNPLSPVNTILEDKNDQNVRLFTQMCFVPNGLSIPKGLTQNMQDLRVDGSLSIEVLSRIALRTVSSRTDYSSFLITPILGNKVLTPMEFTFDSDRPKFVELEDKIVPHSTLWLRIVLQRGAGGIRRDLEILGTMAVPLTPRTLQELHVLSREYPLMGKPGKKVGAVQLRTQFLPQPGTVIIKDSDPSLMIHVMKMKDFFGSSIPGKKDPFVRFSLLGAASDFVKIGEAQTSVASEGSEGSAPRWGETLGIPLPPELTEKQQDNYILEIMVFSASRLEKAASSDAQGASPTLLGSSKVRVPHSVLNPGPAKERGAVLTWFEVKTPFLNSQRSRKFSGKIQLAMWLKGQGSERTPNNLVSANQGGVKSDQGVGEALGIRAQAEKGMNVLGGKGLFLCQIKDLKIETATRKCAREVDGKPKGEKYTKGLIRDVRLRVDREAKNRKEPILVNVDLGKNSSEAPNLLLPVPHNVGKVVFCKIGSSASGLDFSVQRAFEIAPYLSFPGQEIQHQHEMTAVGDDSDSSDDGANENIPEAKQKQVAANRRNNAPERNALATISAVYIPHTSGDLVVDVEAARLVGSCCSFFASGDESCFLRARILPKGPWGFTSLVSPNLSRRSSQEVPLNFKQTRIHLLLNTTRHCQLGLDGHPALELAIFHNSSFSACNMLGRTTMPLAEILCRQGKNALYVTSELVGYEGNSAPAAVVGYYLQYTHLELPKLAEPPVQPLKMRRRSSFRGMEGDDDIDAQVANALCKLKTAFYEIDLKEQGRVPATALSKQLSELEPELKTLRLGRRKVAGMNIEGLEKGRLLYEAQEMLQQLDTSRTGQINWWEWVCFLEDLRRAGLRLGISDPERIRREAQKLQPPDHYTAATQNKTDTVKKLDRKCCTPKEAIPEATSSGQSYVQLMEENLTLKAQIKQLKGGKKKLANKLKQLGEAKHNFVRKLNAADPSNGTLLYHHTMSEGKVKNGRYDRTAIDFYQHTTKTDKDSLLQENMSLKVTIKELKQKNKTDLAKSQRKMQQMHKDFSNQKHAFNSTLQQALTLGKRSSRKRIKGNQGLDQDEFSLHSQLMEEREINNMLMKAIKKLQKEPQLEQQLEPQHEPEAKVEEPEEQVPDPPAPCQHEEVISALKLELEDWKHNIGTMEGVIKEKAGEIYDLRAENVKLKGDVRVAKKKSESYKLQVFELKESVGMEKKKAASLGKRLEDAERRIRNLAQKDQERTLAEEKRLKVAKQARLRHEKILAEMELEKQSKEGASVIMQKWCRRFLCQMVYAKTRKLVIYVQAVSRMFIAIQKAQDERKILSENATTIQKIQRARMGRKDLLRKRRAAIFVQSRIRGFLAKVLVGPTFKEYKRVRYEGARTIQANYRSWVARNRYIRFVWAVTKLQAFQRVVHSKIALQLQRWAISTIFRYARKWWRRLLLLREWERIRLAEVRLLMSIKIQALMRCIIVRNKYIPYILERRAAATTIQSMYRGMIGRRIAYKFKEVVRKAAAVVIQRRVRGMKARKLFKIKIQEEQQRIEALRQKCACKIQSVSRVLLAKKIFVMLQEQKKLEEERRIAALAKQEEERIRQMLKACWYRREQEGLLLKHVAQTFLYPRVHVGLRNKRQSKYDKYAFGNRLDLKSLLAERLQAIEADLSKRRIPLPDVHDADCEAMKRILSPSLQRLEGRIVKSLKGSESKKQYHQSNQLIIKELAQELGQADSTENPTGVLTIDWEVKVFVQSIDPESGDECFRWCMGRVIGYEPEDDQILVKIYDFEACIKFDADSDDVKFVEKIQRIPDSIKTIMNLLSA